MKTGAFDNNNIGMFFPFLFFFFGMLLLIVVLCLLSLLLFQSWWRRLRQQVILTTTLLPMVNVEATMTALMLNFDNVLWTMPTEQEKLKDMEDPKENKEIFSSS